MKLQTLVLSRVLFILIAVTILVLPSSVNPRAVKSGDVLLKYDPTAEQTIGVVENVQVFQCPLSAEAGTHLALRTPRPAFALGRAAPRTQSRSAPRRQYA